MVGAEESQAINDSFRVIHRGTAAWNSRPLGTPPAVPGRPTSAGTWHKGPRNRSGTPTPMIRLDNISKQQGHQLLFIEASAALNRGEKVGLVGPNGAGKTTLFRMITGEEQPDEGQVAVDRGITIGYF